MSNSETGFKAACVQTCAGADMDANLGAAEELVRRAVEEGAALVCLPEFFSFLHVEGRHLDVGEQREDSHPALQRLQAVAAECQAWILLGSLAVQADGVRKNRSMLIDASGSVVARYDKIHMFDVDLANGESYRESDTFEPGNEAVLAPTPWGLLGMTVCYDLRFASLYRALAQAGANFISIPAAFTRTTGKAHWHVLIRARAVETGCYVFAPSQYGRHGDAATYGYSLIVDPWGKVLADAGDGPAIITCDVDVARVAEARRMIPCLKHDRDFTLPAPVTVKSALG